MSVRNATNSAEVCRAAVLPRTSPVLVLKAAYSKTVPFRASRGQRQNRILAIQGLDGGFFIHAEHRGMRWRVQVQPNNVGGLLLKMRIVRGHVALDAMRLESVLMPHPCHHHVADVQMRSEFARAPVGCSSWLQNPGCSRCARTLHPTYGPRPAARSAAPVGHLPPDPSGYWRVASVP